MKTLAKEIAANVSKFSSDWPGQLKATMTTLASEKPRLGECYRRLCSLQAWRVELLDDLLPPEAMAFFAEAQNDGVYSLVLASMGCWRVALQCLRSTLENTLQCLYYKDHPIELRLWQQGRHRLQYSVLEKYLQSHPELMDHQLSKKVLSDLHSEFATLSQAVHGSSDSFRMTAQTHTTLFFSDSKVRLSAWKTRLGKTLAAVNMLLVIVFREHLQGTRRSNLRKTVSFAIPVRQHPRMFADLSVRLYRP